MLFNSYTFIFLFLPVTIIVYMALNRYHQVIAAKSWLFVSSLFFYGWWNSAYVFLLLASILVNYFISQLMVSAGETDRYKLSRKKILLSGLIFNIGLLGYFKYTDFLVANANSLLSANIPLQNIILPLAISFFTLQQIAFLIDVYEGLVKRQRFLDYALFVSFFPQLIAGPIVHHKEMMPQFFRKRNKIINYENISHGIFIFSIGLFKKVMIADTFAIWANNGFDTATSLTLLEAWSVSLSYTLQLYYDFSGYMDMAVGLGLMFNIKLPRNFNSPYKATSIINFWSRWHITLTNFITTYIYTPILKMAPGKITFARSLTATFLAMFLSGIWHGAAWTFFVWGAMHGLALVLNHQWRKLKLPMPAILGWFITFNFINIASVIFRAKTWDDAIKVFKGMIGTTGIEFPNYTYAYLGVLENIGIKFGKTFSTIVTESLGSGLMIGMIILFSLIAFVGPNTMTLNERYVAGRFTNIIVAFIFIIPVMFLNRVTEFIYFNF